ncbi:BnaC03g27470D [Brassica napus]|uniref:BnaC03g27470D protein n=3 Tax=Brassica TaxID=3705 RepID=A0A078G4R7_BRANA|nr:BnaC03g27470D [Brassica napus]VDC91040.1 unnamed protein product [Brassica oleracea]
MDKGKAVMGTGRRWAVDFSDQSTVPSSRDILDPPGFIRVYPPPLRADFVLFSSALPRLWRFSS